MSKQQNDIGSLLRLLFDDVQEEVTLNKITKSNLHRGIRVDFYIPSKHLIIEVHGIQHYKPSGFGNNEIQTRTNFTHQLARDARLRTICQRFSINYKEIAYNESVTVKDFLHLLEDTDD